jgi:hypothetical protein
LFRPGNTCVIFSGVCVHLWSSDSTVPGLLAISFRSPSTCSYNFPCTMNQHVTDTAATANATAAATSSASRDRIGRDR